MAEPTGVWPPPPTQGPPERQPKNAAKPKSDALDNLSLGAGVVSLLTCYALFVSLPLAAFGLLAGLRDKKRGIYSKIGMFISGAVVILDVLLVLHSLRSGLKW